MTELAIAKINEFIPEEYDLVVVASGEGSKFVAWMPVSVAHDVREKQ